MLLKDVRENEMIVKEIPQDPVWLDPQTECLDKVNRNRTTPGNALREFSETYYNLSDKYFVQDSLTFIVGCVLFISIVEHVPCCKLHCYTEEKED